MPARHPITLTILVLTRPRLTKACRLLRHPSVDSQRTGVTCCSRLRLPRCLHPSNPSHDPSMPTGQHMTRACQRSGLHEPMTMTRTMTIAACAGRLPSGPSMPPTVRPSSSCCPFEPLAGASTCRAPTPWSCTTQIPTPRTRSRRSRGPTASGRRAKCACSTWRLSQTPRLAMAR